MSQIALKFGGTIDKFIGDALMIFFGDPESKGPQEDAKQCIQMALEMQDLMTQLSDYWSKNYSLKKVGSIKNCDYIIKGDNRIELEKIINRGNCSETELFNILSKCIF